MKNGFQGIKSLIECGFGGKTHRSVSNSSKLPSYENYSSEEI
jgi:hypothetical protein